MEELILLRDSGVLGNIKEDLSVLSANSLTEVGNCELGSINLLLELGAGDLRRRRTNLLEDPVNNIVLSAATGVLDLLTLPI